MVAEFAAFLQAELHSTRAELSGVRVENERLQGEVRELRSQCGITEIELVSLRARLHRLGNSQLLAGEEQEALLDAICDFGLQPSDRATCGAVHMMLRISGLFEGDDSGCVRQLRRKCF